MVSDRRPSRFDVDKWFEDLLSGCHGDTATVADKAAFVNTIHVCVAEGADIAAVQRILKDACEQSFSGKWRTRRFPLVAKRRKELRKVKPSLERALRKIIQLHKELDQHRLGSELSQPYRAALEYLTSGADVLVRTTSQPRHERVSAPKSVWQPRIFRELSEAGVKSTHHRALLRALGLI